MSVTTELRVLPAVDLSFPVGLPGFKGVRRFRLEPLRHGRSANPFGRLVALEPVELADGTLAETVRLIVAAPGLLWPDYVVEVDTEIETLLQLDDAADAAALVVVVTLGPTIATSSANLFAPIALNTRKLLATQIVPKYGEGPGGRSIHTPLPLSDF